MAEDQPIADSDAWGNFWALTEKQATKQGKEFSKAIQTWKPQIYIQIFPPSSFSVNLEHLQQREKLEWDGFRKEREVG